MVVDFDFISKVPKAVPISKTLTFCNLQYHAYIELFTAGANWFDQLFRHLYLLQRPKMVLYNNTHQMTDKCSNANCVQTADQIGFSTWTWKGKTQQFISIVIAEVAAEVEFS